MTEDRPAFVVVGDVPRSRPALVIEEKPAKPAPASFDPAHPPVGVLTKKDLIAWWSYVVQESGFKGSDRVMASKLLADALGMFKSVTSDGDDFDASKMTDEELVANVKALLVACKPPDADVETSPTK